MPQALVIPIAVAVVGAVVSSVAQAAMAPKQQATADMYNENEDNDDDDDEGAKEVLLRATNHGLVAAADALTNRYANGNSFFQPQNTPPPVWKNPDN